MLQTANTKGSGDLASRCYGSVVARPRVRPRHRGGAEHLASGTASPQAQPALSQSLQRMERRLGARLFERTSRRVAPTPAGEVLAKAAESILGDVRRAVERTRVTAGLPGVLRIHVSEPSLLTPRRILAAARANVPQVAIHQTTLPRADVARQLLAGDLHLAIGGRFRRPGLSSIYVREERVGALVGSRHPLAEAPCVTAADLSLFPILSVDEEMSSWNDWVLRYLAEHDLGPTWTREVIFGLSTGGDILHDQQSVLLTLESVGRDYLDGLVWKPLEPARTVPWFITYSDEELSASPAVATVLRVTERLAIDQGWTASENVR
nr:LysR family transcriptional regulator [Nocardioides sp. J54]